MQSTNSEHSYHNYNVTKSHRRLTDLFLARFITDGRSDTDDVFTVDSSTLAIT